MRILLINGPPRSGKDSCAWMLAKVLEQRGVSATISKFAWVLKNMVHRALSLAPDGLPDDLEDVKDLPHPKLNGRTPRESYIAMSEQFIKPLLGDRWFGERLAESIEVEDEGSSDVVLVPDSGFATEAEVLMERWPGDVRLLRLHRPGRTFAGDSRSHLDLDVPSMDLHNAGTIDDFAAKLGAVADWLSEGMPE